MYIYVCVCVYIVQDFNCEYVSTTATALWNLDLGAPISD